MDKPIVIDTVQGVEIYTFAKDLSQDDIPYEVISGSRPGSKKDFTLYADTITVSGPLVNPGKALTLVGRQIVITQPLLLDVGGPDPDKSFTPGDLPEQSETGFGSVGATGADGTASSSAGSLTLVAEQIVYSGASAGQVETFDSWVTALLTDLVTQAKVGLTDFPFQSVGIDDNGTTFQAAGITLVGLETWQGSSLRRTNAGGAQLELTFAALALGGHLDTNGPAVSSNSFPASAIVSIAPGVGAAQFSAQVDPIDTPVTVTIQGMSQTFPVATADIQVTITQALTTVLAPALETNLQSGLSKFALALLAQGGDGARGQDGHPGIVGQQGTPGMKSSDFGYMNCGEGIIVSYPEGTQGGPGNQGGQGGSAGHSTDGAPGGTMTLGLVTPFGGQTLVSVMGGAGGLQASPGAPGDGGKGGPGADVEFKCVDQSGDGQDGCAPYGKDGEAGKPADFAGNRGLNASPGTALLQGVPLQSGAFPAGTYGQVAAQYPLALLQIVDQQAALDYMNAASPADFAAVAQLYTWLANITQPFLAGQPPASSLSLQDLAVRQQLNAAAQVELARMAQGLDFYGHTYNWVPVLSMQALQTRIQQLLSIGNMIETTYNSFYDKNASLAQQLNAVDTACTQLTQALTADQAEIDALDGQIKAAYQSVLSSLDAVNAQRNQLATAEYDFKTQFTQYVLKKHTQCTFERVLDGAITVVSIGAEAVSGVGEVEAIGEASDVFKAAEGITKLIKKAKATFGEIQKAYESVESQLDKDADIAKIVVKEDKFKKFIAKYTGKFPAANELNKAVKHYFDLIDAHNKIALGYTSLWIKQYRLKQQVALKQASVENIAAQRAAQKAQEVPPEYVAFMSEAYLHIKNMLLLNLYEFNRAYEYWSLQPQPFSVAASDIASLASTYSNWLAQIDEYLDQSGPFQPFNQDILITASDFSAGFALLPGTKKLAFNLDLPTWYSRCFPNMTHVTVDSVTIQLPDLQPASGAAFLSLVHCGTSVQNSDVNITAQNALHTFSHAPRAIPFKIDYGDPQNSAGGLIGDDTQGFPGLSPFTLWTLDFDQEGNEWIDLTKIQQVKLRFTGKFLSQT